MLVFEKNRAQRAVFSPESQGCFPFPLFSPGETEVKRARSAFLPDPDKPLPIWPDAMVSRSEWPPEIDI